LSTQYFSTTHLCNVQEQERHHESEQTSGFGEGETQDGVLEELATEGRVAGDTLNETAEDGTDTDTSTSETDGGDTGTLDLGGGDHGGGSGLGDDAAGLDGVADDALGEVVAHGAKDEAVLALYDHAGRSCDEALSQFRSSMALNGKLLMEWERALKLCAGDGGGQSALLTSE
jgi:hypothetical protein